MKTRREPGDISEKDLFQGGSEKEERKTAHLPAQTKSCLRKSLNNQNECGISLSQKWHLRGKLNLPNEPTQE